MKIWQKWSLGIIAIVAIALAYIFWPQGVWPFVTNLSELAAVGDNYDVEILRDSYGVPHIFGKTDADAAYGLGFAHSEDDFQTIQQAFIAARGKLGVAYGIDAAPNDFLVALLRIWETIDAGYANLPANDRAIMRGYADGLNHYAALHPDEVILAELFPVRGEDIAAGFMHRVPLFFGLDGALADLFAETRQKDVAEEQVSGEAEGDSSCPLAPLLPCTPGQYGSNVIAVGPGRSANGETFLAVNSHQPWEGIVAWYEAHVVSEEGWDMAGALLPGSPTITHGHNRYLGWSFTVNSPDLVDVYVLEINPDNPDQYRFDGEWLDLEVADAPITVTLFGRFRWTVKQEVLWSVYGPTVRVDHGTYAIRYAGMGEMGHAGQFLALNKATNFEEWQAALATGPLPMFNAGYADAEGNVYYVYNGLIPQRNPNYDWSLYLPGDRSATLWTDYVPFEQLPQVLNPPSGFVANSNNDPYMTTVGAGNPDPAVFSATMGIDDGLSNRILQTMALFGADESITAEEFAAYKYDMGYHPDSLVARFVETAVSLPPPTNPDERALWDLITSWDLQTTTTSKGATATLIAMYYAHEDGGLDLDWSKLVAGEISAEAVATGITGAVEHLLTHFERVDVAWGEVNRLRRGDVDLPVGGGPDVLHAIYGAFDEDGRFRGIAGDSYIMLVTWDENGRVTSESIHQYGSATLDKTSPFYADQAPIFAARELKPVWLDVDDIRANLSRAYRPGE